MHSPRSPSLNRESPFQSSLLHSEHLDSRRREKTNKFRDSPVATIASFFPLSTFIRKHWLLQTSCCPTFE
jgi:hypothetical protein